ncbi:CvpA family protein [Campylobacter troglodytis]|uniref:CvpA family protein n=1 Tax=Campylobacter troglodytis TaxID=654363 RepID=UPI00115AFD8D|nr:colicin V synthesis protein [Campylobacter troglodytis]
MNLYWFDILILAFTFLLGLRGIISGLVKEVFGLLGIIGGVLLASRYSQTVGQLIDSKIYKIANDDLMLFAGFLVILIIFWILCLLMGLLLSKLVTMSGLGFLNRLGGFLFGCAKIFLIFAILIFCIGRFSYFDEQLDKYTQGSFILPTLKKAGAFIMNNPSVKKGIDETINSFDLESKELENTAENNTTH